MALALSNKGVPAVSLQAHQVPIVTDDQHGGASFKPWLPNASANYWMRPEVVVVTGYQGVTGSGDLRRWDGEGRI